MSRNTDGNDTQDECRARLPPPPPTMLRSGSCWRSVCPSSHPRQPRRRRKSRASISFDSNMRPPLQTWRVSSCTPPVGGPMHAPVGAGGGVGGTTLMCCGASVVISAKRGQERRLGTGCVFSLPIQFSFSLLGILGESL